MIDTLQKKIAAKSAELEKLRLKAERIEGEIRGLGEALKVLQGDEVDESRTSGTRLSEDWRAVLNGLAYRHGDGQWSLDDVAEIARDVDFEVQRQTIRSQASIYAGNGWIERVSQGQYRITPKGKEDLNLSFKPYQRKQKRSVDLNSNDFGGGDLDDEIPF